MDSYPDLIVPASRGGRMGRKSREKKERRERESNSAISSALQGLSTDSVFSLLEAASISPSSAHHCPSIAFLFHSAAHRPRSRGRQAAASDLPALVDAVASEQGQIMAMLEDFEPYDARAEVLVRWGASVFRMIPGSLERPTATVDLYDRIATTIDEVLVEEIGFGLRDVGELILRRLDAAGTSLSAHWRSGPPASIGSPPHVSDQEIVAAALLPTLEDVVGACMHPDRAAKAAERFVRPAGELSFHADGISTFGPVIAVALGAGTVWLPSGVLVESLCAIGNDLTSLATARSGHLDTRYFHSVWDHVDRILQGTGHQLVGPIRTADGSVTHSVIEFNEGQFLALDVAAGLTPSTIQHRLDNGSRALSEIRPGALVRTPESSWLIPPFASVERLQILSRPFQTVPLGSSTTTMSLEDVRWILHSSQSSPKDLWYFVRDLSEQSGLDGLTSCDLIDLWEVWKPQKSFYRGGTPVRLVVAPHAAVAEWNDAADTAPTERALAKLGLPAVRSWPLVTVDSYDGTEVADAATGRAYHILPLDFPVAVAKWDPGAPSAHFETLYHLAVGLTSKLRSCAVAFVSAAQVSGLAALRIEFEYQVRSVGPALTKERFANQVLTISWDDRLLESLATNSFAVEDRCGELVAETLDRRVCDSFLAAWDCSPPGVRIDSIFLRQRAHELPDPVEANRAVRSEVLRRLSEHLAATGAQSGRLEGAEATRFESKTVFPWLLHEFHKSIAHLSPGELLAFALRQLEHANYHRFMVDKRLALRRGFPDHRLDDLRDREEHITRARHSISFIVEEVIHQPPRGETPTNENDWVEALAIAELCIESCFRSDAIHFQLSASAIELSDFLEINLVTNLDPTDIDVQAYLRARAARVLPAGVPISVGLDSDADGEVVDRRPLTERRPELADIDKALRSGLGFSIESLTGVLTAATECDAVPGNPVHVTKPHLFAQQCDESVLNEGADTIEKAVDWLTLHRSELATDGVIRHWEVERRSKRVTTSPLVPTQESLSILPWTAETTLRILINYLEDGRLPWPDEVLPEAVTRALDQYRQSRNRAVEKTCVANLSDRSLIARGNIEPRKAKRYGIETLSGEIDTLCIDPARSRIWVVETKDPYIPYTARSIRRQADHFLRDGGYIDQLVQKTDDIVASASSVAAALGADDPERSWEVMALFATRRVEPAAFAIEPLVAFCLVDEVADVIDRDGPIGPGMHFLG